MTVPIQTGMACGYRGFKPNTPRVHQSILGQKYDGANLKEEDILSVYFDFDSYELDKIAQITLIKVAQRMKI